MNALCVCVCVCVCARVCDFFSVQGPPGEATGVQGDKVGFPLWVVIIISLAHTWLCINTWDMDVGQNRYYTPKHILACYYDFDDKYDEDEEDYL